MAILEVLTKKGFDMLDFVELFDKDPKIKVTNFTDEALTLTLNLKNLGYTIDLAGKYDPETFSGTIKRLVISSGDGNLLQIYDFKLNIDIEDFQRIKEDPQSLINDIVNQQFTARGNVGDDFIFGGPGTYSGSDGNDTLAAFGEAEFDGASGKLDTVTYELINSGAGIGVTASLADPSKNTGVATGHTYVSIEGLTGTANNDTLIGNGKKNTLTGGDGSDTLEGGKDKDELLGGEGVDFASYLGAKSIRGDFTTGVTISLGDPDSSDWTGDARDDVYKAIEGVIGSQFNDKLTGAGNGFLLLGAQGDDTVSGGANDELWGDLKTFGTDGDDTFLFRSADAGAVKIMDFDVFDKVAISRKGFDLAKSFAFEDGVNFISADKPVATGDGPTFLFNRGVQGADFKYRGELFFDADGKGGEAAVLIAKMAFDSQQYLDIFDVTVV